VISSVKAYATLSDIPYVLDLAMIILPPNLAAAAVDEAIGKGTKEIVIVSAGFKEISGEGPRIEKQIVARCREAGVRLVSHENTQLTEIANKTRDMNLSIRNIYLGSASSESFAHNMRSVTPMNMSVVPRLFKSRKPAIEFHPSDYVNDPCH